MPRLYRIAATSVAAVCLGLGSGAAADPPLDGARPLTTGVLSGNVAGSAAQAAFGRIADLGASTVVLDLDWSTVVSPAAGGAGDFDPTDPASPYYNWAPYDEEVQIAAAHGLKVIALILNAPAWALRSAAGEPPNLPDPDALAGFAAAAVTRYSGTYAGLPAVTYWEIWNEPNLSPNLSPQFVNGQPYAPGWYRTMVNKAYDAIKGREPDDLVIAGGTAPFFDNTPAVRAVASDWGPLSFMRSFLCLSDTLQPTCSTPAEFDVWAMHPYTEGGPEHHASLPNDVSLPDVPKMRAVLQEAELAGHVVSAGQVQLWAPEFSWDSNPPDPAAVPEAELLRWVPQALYELWQAGVSVVDWFTLYDAPYPDDLYQSGLALSDGTAKPHAQAFAFPLVGISHRTQLEVWGRAPGGHQANVTIQHYVSGSWNTIGIVTSDAEGIFQAHFVAQPTGLLRAFAAGDSSAYFPLGTDPDVDVVYPSFGGSLLEPGPLPWRVAIPPSLTGGSPARIASEQRLRAGLVP